MPLKLKVYPTGTVPAKPAGQKKLPDATKDAGRMILFQNEAGLLVPGEIVKAVSGGGHYEVKLAVPNSLGLLVVTKSTTIVDKDSVTFVDAAKRAGDVREWRTQKPVDGVKATEIKDGDVIVDLKDVTFTGYGSTFAEFTPEDRDGDNVAPDAFDESIEQFRKNPVMLIDHTRRVASMAGSYSSVATNKVGLIVTGEVSNAPGMRDVRFLVNEGHLKTMSMGGLFFYAEDYKTIEKVDLHEISLVVVPANPDAEFSTRGLDADDCGKAFQKHAKAHAGEVRSK